MTKEDILRDRIDPNTVDIDEDEIAAEVEGASDDEFHEE